ncbi:hypothetical protein B0H10DRAFT_1964731 [Mycena sp. CBHHK59/15]|nr:hypothetical protein B0H10DRAFT_1964731 [Mycena sp. CBHHK59/15]
MDTEPHGQTPEAQLTWYKNYTRLLQEQLAETQESRDETVLQMAQKLENARYELALTQGENEGGLHSGAVIMVRFIVKSLLPHYGCLIHGEHTFWPDPKILPFNGKGAQEATDLLLLALIHPQMPALYVCQNNKLWLRFLQTVIDYDKNQMDLVLPGSKLLHVSGDRQFHMNTDGHAQ